MSDTLHESTGFISPEEFEAQRRPEDARRAFVDCATMQPGREVWVAHDVEESLYEVSVTPDLAQSSEGYHEFTVRINGLVEPDDNSVMRQHDVPGEYRVYRSRGKYEVDKVDPVNKQGAVLPDSARRHQATHRQLIEVGLLLTAANTTRMQEDVAKSAGSSAVALWSGML